jgi:hypothetical protein
MFGSTLSSSFSRLLGLPPPPRGVRRPKEPTVQALRNLTPTLHRAAHGDLTDNRRCEIRRAIRLGCRARKVGSVGLVGDRTLDLSPQGMLLLSDERIEPGTELAVSFFATDLPIWFDTRATVARVVQGRRPGDPARALGLVFRSLPAVSRLILRGHLRRYPATMPSRAPAVDFDGGQVDYARIVKEIYYGR